MLKTSLCDDSDAHVHVNVKDITIPNIGTVSNSNNRCIKVTFKNCAQFTDCISKINNTQVDNAKDSSVIIIPMNNFIQ